MKAYEIALSDSEGRATLSMPEGGSSGRATIASVAGSTIASVETRRLDSYEFANVGFMKVDVEGHEEAVLNGAIDMLKKWHPILFVEIEERHNPGAVTRIPAMLADIGYTHCYFLYRGRLHPMDGFDIETHQLRVNSSVSPSYVNNFVFATNPVI